MWHTVGGAMHYFPGYTMKTLMWELSYANLCMLLATIPSYDSESETTNEKTMQKAQEKEKANELKSFFAGTKPKG